MRFTGNILQFKFGRATKETGKFLINSTVGIGGLINVTKDDPTFDFPEEDIGQALGSWGVKHGFYIVLPILGPSTIRDFVGRLGGNVVDPLSEPWTQVDDTHDRLILQGTDTINDLPEIIDLYQSHRFSNRPLRRRSRRIHSVPSQSNRRVRSSHCCPQTARSLRLRSTLSVIENRLLKRF